jgi:hypothetical protein
MIVMMINIQHITDVTWIRSVLGGSIIIPFLVIAYLVDVKATEEEKQYFNNFSTIAILSIFAFFYGLKFIRKKNLYLFVDQLKEGIDKKELNYYLIVEKFGNKKSCKVHEHVKVFWCFYRMSNSFYASLDDLTPIVNIDDQLASNKAVTKFNL